MNRVRNKCAHHWVLDIPRYRIVRAGQKKKRVRIPVVLYRGSNLMKRDVFKAFSRKPGSVCLKLLWKVWKVQGKI